MKKTITLTFLVFTAIVCKSQLNKTKEMEPAVLRYQNETIKEEAELAYTLLKKLAYRMPDNTLFEKRVADVFHINVASCVYDNILLTKDQDHYPFMPIAIRKRNFIFIGDPNYKDKNGNPLILDTISLYFNNYIFYHSKSDRNALILNEQSLAMLYNVLLMRFGYCEDTNLIKRYIEKDVGVTIPDYNYPIVNNTICELMFGTDDFSNVNEFDQLRLPMFDTLTQMMGGNELFKNALQEMIDRIKGISDFKRPKFKTKKDEYKILAYIFNAFYAADDSDHKLDAEQCYLSFIGRNNDIAHIEFIRTLQDSHCFGLALLEKHISWSYEKIKNYNPLLSPTAGMYKGVINDPDGYVNVRKQRRITSPIVAQINQGEQFFYWTATTSDWFEVLTQHGTSGYVHKSRIVKVE